MVARKLLSARSQQQHHDEQRIQLIIETLAEKTYQHGHAIGRREAKEIGLNITHPPEKVASLLWELYEAYEELCVLRIPIDARTFIPADKDEHGERVIMGCIESMGIAYHFSGEFRGRHKRQAVPQLTLNLALNLQLPPNIQAEQLPTAAQQAMQQMIQEFQQQAQALIQKELRNQMPVIGFDAWLQDAGWRQIEDWPAIQKSEEE